MEKTEMGNADSEYTSHKQWMGTIKILYTFISLHAYLVQTLSTMKTIGIKQWQDLPNYDMYEKEKESYSKSTTLDGNL